MRDLLSWNLSLGRWAGVQVRLHVFFLLFVVLAIHSSTRDQDGDLLWDALLIPGVLFLSVLAHEFGHCYAAWKVGGTADQVLIWPLGGLAQVNVSHEPFNELATSLAGPLVNFTVCLLTLPLLLLFGAQTDLLRLIHPFAPPWTDQTSVWAAAELVFWINWMLLLVNLLPAYPLDGGRVLRSLLWFRYGYRTSVVVVARVAMVTAVGLCVLPWLIPKDHQAYAMAPLMLIGIFLFFSAKHEGERLHEQDPEDAPFGYDFSQGYTSLEKTLAPPRKRGPGPVRKWLDSRRATRLLRQQQIEADEERRVDDVLARLHQGGIEAISADDRALLDRVSARYRNRQRG